MLTDILGDRLSQQAAVAELGRLALGGVPQQPLLERAAHLATQALQADYASILEVQGQELLWRAGSGWLQAVPEGPQEHSHGWFTLQSQAPVISQDMAQETRYRPSLRLRQNRVVSAVSVVIAGFGVLGVYSSSPRCFSPDDVNCLQALAYVVSAQVQGSRAQEISDRRTRLMAFQAQAFQALSHHSQVPPLLEACVQAMVEHLDAAFARVWVVGPDRMLELAAAAGLDAGVRGPLRLGRYRVGRVAQTAQPMVSNTVLSDPESHDRAWLASHGIVGFAGYPLMVEDRRDPRFRQLPILALTAHALPEERERCYAAGMSDYLAKPIDPEALFATLRRWLPGAVTPQVGAGRFPDIAGLDTRAGLVRTAGNQGLYRSLLLGLAEQREDILADLELALATGDTVRLGQLAHALRGQAGNLGADELQSGAAQVERWAREDNLSTLTLSLAGLGRAWEEVGVAILESLVPAPPILPGSPPCQLQQMSERLDALLREGDGAAGEFMMPLLQHLGPRGQPLARLVQAFDFDGARLELRELKLIEREGQVL